MSFVIVKGSCSYRLHIPRLHHLPISPLTLSQAFKAHHSMPLMPASTWQICVEMKLDHPQEGLSPVPSTQNGLHESDLNRHCCLSFFFVLYLFIYVASFACLYFLWLWHVGCSSPPRVESRPPALGAWRLSHQTTREVPGMTFNLCLVSLSLRGEQRYTDELEQFPPRGWADQMQFEWSQQ